MGRKKDQKAARSKEGGGPSLMMKLLVLLCVASSMALVLRLNLTNQHNLMLRNIKGVEEPRIWVAQPAVPTCRPRRHLVFLKTHKCGSSTVQNMLMRYAFSQNLSVALPYSGVYLDDVAKGQSLKVKELKGSPFAPPSGRYHFLVHHTRLHVRAIQQLTYDDSVWVTIVREPSAMFESMFHYYHLHKFYGATFDHLIWKLEGNDGGRFKFKNANNRYSGRLGRNQMTWDLGLDDPDMRQESVLKEAIKILDHTFHLVMVAERMDESLVLLQHLMCWGDEDVVALARNVRKDRYRSYLSEHSVTTLEYFNAADVKLYAYFKERFDKQVESFGRGRMEDEVARLRERRDKVWQQCGLQEAASTKRRPHTDLAHTDKGSYNKGSQADKGSYNDKASHTDKGEKGQYLVIQYEMHNNGSYRERRYCKDLIRSSVEFTQLLRWKQYSRYHYNINNPWNLSWSTSFKKKSKRKSRKVPLLTVRRHHQREKRPPPQHSRR